MRDRRAQPPVPSLVRRVPAVLLPVLLSVGLAAHAFAPGPRGPVVTQPRIVAHEWGVWRLEQGRITHLRDLAAELPAFVERSPMALLGGGDVEVDPLPLPVPPHPVIVPPPPPRPPPPVPPRPWDQQLSRKPVLFLYASAPVDVTVEVDFAGGEPWLYYPHAAASRDTSTLAGTGRLRWEGRLDPGAAPPLLGVPATHFWSDLRNVGGTPFVTADGSAERFLFYDGPVDFLRPFVITRMPGGAQVAPSSDESSLWLADGRSFVESKASTRTGGVMMAQGDMALLRTRLLAECIARGLSDAEGRSLLDTWRDELFASPRPRAIYFVPRAWYDRMLPLRITPAPAEIVRVGLVIELL